MGFVAVAIGAAAVVMGPAPAAHAIAFNTTVNASLAVSSSPGYAAVTGIPVTIPGCGTIHLDLGVHTNWANFSQMDVASTLVHYYTGPLTIAYQDFILTPAGGRALYSYRYATVGANGNQLFRTYGPVILNMNGLRHIVYDVQGWMGSQNSGGCDFDVTMNVNLH